MYFNITINEWNSNEIRIMTVFNDNSMFGSIVHIMTSSSYLLAYWCSLSTKHSFINDSRLCYEE